MKPSNLSILIVSLLLILSTGSVVVASLSIEATSVNFLQPIGVGTPTEDYHAATRGYVHTVLVDGFSGSGGYVLTSRNISTGSGLAGGGNLTADRTLTVDSTVIRTTGNQTLAGTKTFSSAVVLNTAGTATNHAVRADRSITPLAGGGLTGGGNLTANRTLAVDSTVIRTTGNQSMAGIKNFTGSVGIGVAAPIEKLEVNGNVVANAYYYTSDIRLKENISNVENSLSKILQLQGISYNLKEKEDRKMGFSAQELQKIYPELVKEGSDGYLSIDGTGLIAPLVEAIKEQQREINELKKKVEELSKN